MEGGGSTFFVVQMTNEEDAIRHTCHATFHIICSTKNRKLTPPGPLITVLLEHGGSPTKALQLLGVSFKNDLSCK